MNRKGLLVSLVMKFLAAYLIVLLLGKTSNMEKTQKIENVLLKFFRGLSCTLKHLYPVSGYCISPGRQKDLKKKKRKKAHWTFL